MKKTYIPKTARRELTYKDRLVIETLYNKGFKVKDIAADLSVSLPTIYREIERGKYQHKNSDWTYTPKYSADKAQTVHDFNVLARGKPLKVNNDHQFVKYVSRKIRKNKYSPQAIIGDIQKHNLEFNTKISYKTIYRYVEQGLIPNVTKKDLPFQGKRKKKPEPKTVQPVPGNKRSIEVRPTEIGQRLSFGHWEMDSIIGKREKGQTLLVMTERLTRFELVFRSKDKTVESTIRILNRLEKRLGRKFKTIFQTITVDNGCEFNNSSKLEKSIYKGNRTIFYYCHPYQSSERGSNEKQNQMLRRYIIKYSKIEDYTDRDLKEAQDWLNNYPRGIFNYESANDRFQRELQKLGIEVDL